MSPRETKQGLRDRMQDEAIQTGSRMTWTHWLAVVIGFFVGGTIGAFGMALCALAGRDQEAGQK